MIPIVKPAAPEVLLTKGVEAKKDLCALFDRGVKEFDFHSAIYAHDTVKRALRLSQHDKCAFCESRLSHVAYGDVEHFRPKAGYKQKASDELKRPGYFWLAYEWSNLFYACQLCNQRFKGNLFPLKDGRRRARTPNADLGNEEPLLIDPSVQDPSTHLGFREEYVLAIADCPQGKQTIEILGLNREELAENRRDRLALLRALV